jgi:hypothetical protein
MLTTYLVGTNFNALTGSYITNLDGIQRLEMALTMGWAKCVPLGIETLALKVR